MILRAASCSFLSFWRMTSYASQVLPSNTSDLIHLLFCRRVSFSLGVGFDGLGQLSHQTTVLQDVQRFLLTLPVFRTKHNEVLPGPSGDSKRLMSANALFYKLFQVVPELVYAYCFHLNHQFMYGNAVRVYSSRHNDHKQSDASFAGAVVDGRFVFRIIGILGKRRDWRYDSFRICDKTPLNEYYR